MEVEQTHANDVFLSNIQIQLHKLQSKLYYHTSWGKKIVPKPEKFALKMKNLLKAADLKVATRFHQRSTEERLRDLEHMLRKVYSVQKRHYYESFPEKNAKQSLIGSRKVSVMNMQDYANLDAKDPIDNLEMLKEEYRLSKEDLQRSKKKSPSKSRKNSKRRYSSY